MLILKQPKITLDGVMVLARAHTLESRVQDMEAAQWKMRGYKAIINARKDRQNEVKVKQEHVYAIRRIPAQTREDRHRSISHHKTV